MPIGLFRGTCRRVLGVRALAGAGVTAMFALAGAGWPSVAVAASEVSRSGHIELTGALHATLMLDHATCSSFTTNHPLTGSTDITDVFEVEAPSFSVKGTHEAWYLDVKMATPKSPGYAYTDNARMILATPSREWDEAAPAKDVKFAAGGRSGSLNVVFPKQENGKPGTVHIVASWSAGACISKSPPNLPA
jgi:hypothetical protein